MPEIIYQDPNRFYVYVFLREDRSPYYIGKGTGKRAWSNSRRKVSPPADKSRIVLLKENLSEQEAFDHEIELIKFHGRKDNGTGILRNLTDGGEGKSGYNTSDETKEKIRESELGKIVSDATKEKMREAQLGKKASDATKEKIRKAKLTENLSDVTREKMREAQLGKKASDAVKEKMRETKLGKKRSPETLMKINETKIRNKEAKLLLENQLTSSTENFGSAVW